jgi:hypothetical protein
MVLRLDFGRLDKAQPHAGGYRIPATVSRTGIQVYRDSNGKEIREYRPKDEVFSEPSLDSLEGATVTRGHPAQMVEPTNWGTLAGGHVAKVSRSGVQLDGEDFVPTQLQVHRADILADLDSGALAEISLGYTCDLDFTPGVTPKGERYDAVQRNIRVNHVALLPKNDARAGREARIRLDGNQEILGAEPQQKETPDMLKVKVDGIEYDSGSPAHISALEKQAQTATARADAAEAKAQAAADALVKAEAATAAQTARAVAAEAILAPASIAALVKDELAFRARAAKVLPKEFVFDGKTRRDVQIAALKAVKVDTAADATDLWVSANFDARIDAIHEDHTPKGGTVQSDATDPYQIMQEKRDAARKVAN